MSDPRIWGTDLWKTLHRFSLAYPEESPSDQHKQKARDFYGSLDYLLPCPYCRIHYGRYFKRTFNDKTVENRKSLVQWVYDLHNEVSRRLGKPDNDISVEDLPRLYNSFPLRYVDLETGDLLDKPRHAVTEGRDCPSDELALETLLKKKEANDAVNKDSDNIEAKNSHNKENTNENEQKTPEIAVTMEVLGDTRNPVDKPQFWSSPWGVSLLWLVGIFAVLLLLVLLRSISQARKQSERLKGRQQWIAVGDSNRTSGRDSDLPPGYQNPWTQ